MRGRRPDRRPSTPVQTRLQERGRRIHLRLDILALMEPQPALEANRFARSAVGQDRVGVETGAAAVAPTSAGLLPGGKDPVPMMWFQKIQAQSDTGAEEQGAVV